MDTNMSFEFECPVTAGYRRNMKNFILVSVSIITVTSDLKTVASTCNDPKIISDTMGKLLRKQDLPPNLIDFIENFEPYQRLITPEPDILKPITRYV